MYYKSITEKKNRLNNLPNKENLFEIKQKLFKELTTNSSRKFKYKGKVDFTYKPINSTKSKNNEEIYLPDNKIIHKTNYLQKTNNSTKNEYKNKYYTTKSYNYRNKTLNAINSISTNNNINNEEDDLLYVIAKDPNKVYEKSKLSIYNIDNDNNNNLISHIALPFCHYHKFNIKLPKRYTCNFKNCCCCQFKERHSAYYNENTKETSRDYIYPSIEKILTSKKRFNNSLEKFMRKNKNKKSINKSKENLNKKEKKKKKIVENFNVNTRENLIKKSINICLKNPNNNKNKNDNTDKNKNNNIKKNKNNKKNNNDKNNNTDKNNNKKERSNSKDLSDNDEISDISIKFQKPDETNIRMPKKEYEDIEKSLSKSFSLEIPEELNIEDESDLREFKDLMKEKNRQSKIHFSVTYYQKLNKSYKVYCNNNKNKNNNNKKSSPFKAKSKEKHFEFLRYKS